MFVLNGKVFVLKTPISLDTPGFSPDFENHDKGVKGSGDPCFVPLDNFLIVALLLDPCDLLTSWTASLLA